MNTPVDIHTHHLPPTPGCAIVNGYPGNFHPEADGWYSVGIHPWQVAPGCMPASRCGEAQTFLSLLQHPQVIAVGEAGLDKLAEAPISLQAEVFEYQARLAMQLGKPLIIHLVRATDELLQLKRTIRPTNPWIIHGFRGKAALAETYLRHGLYLSFGETYQEDALRIVPLRRLFLETDESTLPIDALYRQAAATRQLPVTDLAETIQNNIGKVFFKR